MDIFIRFDIKGTFKGTEHVSQFGDGFDGDEENLRLEPGISCYKFNADGVKNLIDYWQKYGTRTRVEDYEELQLTVFSGEKVGIGLDYEDCATCAETLAELDAAEFYAEFEELQERVWDEEITEDEMYETLAERIREAIA